MVLELFQKIARRAPAYADFLKKQKLRPVDVKTIAAFKKIPIINKENYLRRYPLQELCWDGKLKEKSWIISSTSGSTGQPFYFPRTENQDAQYALTAELYLRTNFDIHKKSTLYIDAFPMGPWIGGVFTYQVIRDIAKRNNYQLSVFTAGIDKKEIIKSVEKFGKIFDQIIIGCYGPFLKDAIDDGLRQGINWKKYNLKFIFSAEGFSEEFRNDIIQKAGLKNPYKDTLNHYGTADQGTLSYETPLAVLIRRLAVKNRKLYRAIFSDVCKLPTLTQYMPEMFYFENIGGKLLCSSDSGLPLVRYDLKDNGGIIGFEEMRQRCRVCGVDILKEAKRAGISDTVWPLPFVYVYERSDFSVSFYAFQIYPETIRKALSRKELREKITGKFTMMVKFDKKRNQVLEINVELKSQVRPLKSLKDKIKHLVTKLLLKENSEYRKTYSAIKNRARPKITLWSYENDIFFKPGIKQKWVKK